MVVSIRDWWYSFTPKWLKGALEILHYIFETFVFLQHVITYIECFLINWAYLWGKGGIRFICDVAQCCESVCVNVHSWCQGLAVQPHTDSQIKHTTGGVVIDLHADSMNAAPRLSCTALFWYGWSGSGCRIVSQAAHLSCCSWRRINVSCWQV